MTYVSNHQNFKKNIITLHWTPRLRSIWLQRNIFTLLVIYKNLIYAFINFSNVISLPYDWKYLTNYFLRRKLHFLLTHVFVKSYGITTSNWVISCSYNTISQGLSCLESPRTVYNTVSLVDTLWYRSYVKPQGLIGIFISKKIYKIELIRFIYIITHTWRSLNSVRYHYSGYPMATKDWSLVRFFGNYYFKFLNF